MFEMHYTGGHYPTMKDINADGKSRGAKYSYWASEWGYSGFYNGDTVVLYDDLNNVPEEFKADAMKYGQMLE